MYYVPQALGPLGLNMADFCKQFNEATKNHVKDVPIPVELSAFANRTFSFQCKTPPTTWFLKNCAGIKKGANRPGHESVGTVHVKQIYEIARKKQQDSHMKELSTEAVCKSIIGSCNSLGIKVVQGE
jgi:large subunit ribosomal protein L11